jgi:hypothetical protein
MRVGEQSCMASYISKQVSKVNKLEVKARSWGFTLTIKFKQLQIMPSMENGAKLNQIS